MKTLMTGKLLLAADESVDDEYEVLDRNGNVTDFAIQVSAPYFTATRIDEDRGEMWFGPERRSLKTALKDAMLQYLKG
jgi:hypothetical protein